MNGRRDWKSWIGIGVLLTGLTGSTVLGWMHFRPEVTSEPSPSKAGGEFLLDDVKQKYIWDLEHFTFELEHEVMRKMIAALRARNRGALQPFLRDGFAASTGMSEPEVVSHNGVTSAICTATNGRKPIGGAREFGEYLMGRLRSFSDIQNVGLRVLKISATDQNPTLGTWDLQLLLTANGHSPDGKRISLEQTSRVTCTFLTDEEIAGGRIFDTWRVQSETVTSSPEFLKEVTASAGLDRLPVHDNWDPDAPAVRQYRAQVTCGDWNGDRRPDLAITTLTGEALVLLCNDAGRFVDATSELGVPSRFSMIDRHWTTASFDLDNDGDDDLLLGPHLYRNTGQGFERMEGTGLQLAFDPMGCAIADYDCDGLLDIYVCYQHALDQRIHGSIGWLEDDQSGAPNQLWRNLGDGRFENVTAAAGVDGGRRHTFAAVWLHANDDHYPDLYVANDFAKNSLLINQGDGTFKDMGDDTGTSDFATSMGVAAADIDGDGSTEIYVANMYSKMGRRIIAQVTEADYPPGVYAQLRGSCAGNRLYRKSREGERYEDISEALGINSVGWAYAPAFVDFDMDGYQDIYATAGFLSFRRDKPDG